MLREQPDILLMQEFYQRHLPHWQPQEAVFFATFRLKNSLPYEVIESLREGRERAKVALHNLPESERAQQNALDEQLYFEKWEEYRDKAQFGPRWLSRPEITDIVKEAMHYRDGKVFDLHAYCIMSDHVPVIFEPLSRLGWQPDLGKSEYYSDLRKLDWQSDLLRLNQIMQFLKRHTGLL